jgi:hypothetical protein
MSDNDLGVAHYIYQWFFMMSHLCYISQGSEANNPTKL